MKALVTGSSGFVGAHLVPRLMAAGWNVVGVDRNPPVTGAEPSLFIQADIHSVDRWRSMLRGTDLIVHLAAAKADWGLSQAAYMRDNYQASQVLANVGR